MNEWATDDSERMDGKLFELKYELLDRLRTLEATDEPPNRLKY